jgi:hypothetical protein
MAADRNKDDIARALHGLSAGSQDSAAEHAEPDTGHVREPAPVKRPSAPKPVQPVQQKPPSRPAAPPAPTSRPAAPARTSSSSTSSSRRVRPAEPGLPPTPSDADFEDVADDDRGADEEAASAATEALDYHGPAPAKPRLRRTPYFKTLAFRRTAIPVLLTTGVMLLAAAVAQRLADAESPLARMGSWSGIVLVVAGLVLITLGVLNMFAVKAELEAKAATGPR